MTQLILLSPYPLKSGIVGVHIRDYIEEYRKMGYSIKAEKMYFWENKLLYSLKWLYLLRYLVNRNNIFFFHQHTPTASGPFIIPFLLLLRLMGYKPIVVAHETPDTYAKYLSPFFKKLYYGYEKAIVALSYHYVVHTALHKREIEKLIHKPNLHIIPLPVPQVIRVVAEKKYWGIYGMVSHKKGVDLLLDAYQALPPGSFPPLKIMGTAAPGDEKYLATIQAKVKPEHAAHIHFTGYVADEDKATLFADVSLMIFPYRWISQSGVLNETCMYRIPYLAADVPFFQDFQESFGGGHLFPQGDVKGLQKVLMELADAPLHIGEEVFTAMEKLFSLDHCASRFQTLIESCKL